MSIARRMQQAASGASGGTTSNPWDISSAVYTANLPRYYVGGTESTPNGIFFKPDGTGMYICGSASDSIHEYVLSTAWSIRTASYVRSKSVGTQDTTPQDVHFRPDGTKMYVVGSGNDRVYEYNLSTAWNISTATYIGFFSVSAQETVPASLFFKPDGTKMYVMGTTGDDVNEYNLSTPWSISTATYLQVKSVVSQESLPSALFFHPDGTKMYVMGPSGDDVNEYNLSTPWNILTATYVQVKSVLTQESAPNGLFFKPDGTKMYIVGTNSRSVFEYDLSTPWNVATATWTPPNTKYFSVLSQEGNPTDLFFKPDGTKMYIIGTFMDTVYEYNLSTAWSVGSASYVQGRSINAQETAPSGLFISADGYKMYVVGTINYRIYQYSMAFSPWNISTASAETSMSLAAYDSYPGGLFFKPDGTKMYVVGQNSISILEFTLNVAWNVTYAQYVQSFSISAQETGPSGVFFKPDGTKMYVCGYNLNNRVHEYNLSTPWNVSTASYLQVRNFTTEDTIPHGIFFNSDGTNMYLISSNGDAVYEYDL